MLPLVTFLLAVLAAHPLEAIMHAEQSGVIDWHRKHIGRVSHAFAVDSKSMIAVSTDKNLFASVENMDGSVKWRKIMPDDNVLRHVYADRGIIVSVQQRKANGLLTAHGWTTARGTLLWEQSLGSGVGIITADGRRFFANISAAPLQLCSLQPSDGSLIQCQKPSAGSAAADAANFESQLLSEVNFQGNSYSFKLVDGVFSASGAGKSFNIPLSDTFALEKVFILQPQVFLVVSAESELHLIDGNRLVWTRHESLAYITGYQFIKLPEPFQLRKHFIPSPNHGLWESYTGRLKHHLVAMKEWLRSAVNIDDVNVSNVPATASADLLLRDKFSLRQLIVVGTKTGSLFAILSDSGRIAWRRQLSRTASPIAAMVASHAVYSQTPPSLVVTITPSFDGDGGGGGAEKTEMTRVWTINPLTGKDIHPSRLASGRYSSASRLPVEDQEGNHAVLLSDSRSANLDILPADPSNPLPALRNLSGSIVLYSSPLSGSLLEGSVVEFVSDADGYRKYPLWSIKLPADERIIAQTGKIDVSVASVGRVLGDRTVMYKYLNPDMIVLATENRRHQFLTIYLVNIATGTILHRSRHDDNLIGQPVNIIGCENWIVYTYWAEQVRERKAQSTAPVQRVVVMELYQSPVPDMKSSSLDQPPFVQSQAYSVGEAVKSLAVTMTQAAVTTREVLLLTESNQIVAISRNLLDPRRPYKTASTMTAEEKEEALIPYQPVLELNAKETITYGLDISIDKLTSQPTALESTTLIFAFGLDLFLTRKLPSKGFDFLDENFSRFTISLLIGGLAVGIVVCRDLAMKRKIKRAWS